MPPFYRIEPTMPNPPDDELVDAVLNQVSDALRGFDFGGSETKDAIRVGLRSALGVFDDVDDLEDLLDHTTDPSPHVVVLDGGRSNDDAPTDSTPPHLRVAQQVDDITAEVPFDAGVYKVADLFTTLTVPGAIGVTPAGTHGKIAVKGANDWQTVFRGARASTYRIFCDAGILEIALDGVVVERVAVGRSIDVEAPLIRVRSTDELRAQGTYNRLS